MTTSHTSGRDDGITPTPRDEGVFGDLGVTDLLETFQVAGRFCPQTGRVYFPALNPDAVDGSKKGGRRDEEHYLPREPSPSSAERRMRRLKAARLLVRRGHRRPGGERTSIWMLSKAAFRREVRDMGLHDATYPGWPKSRVQHFLDTNDLYVGLAGELDAVLEGVCYGPDPAWVWRNERRVYERYSVSWEPKPRYHQPDAEVLFCGRLFIVERQTARARETEEAIAKKVQDHNHRAAHIGAKDTAQIVFACDTLRDTDHALKAGRDSDLPVVAASVAEVVSHLTDQALEHS
jgi:hypothetical protein